MAVATYGEGTYGQVAYGTGEITSEPAPSTAPAVIATVDQDNGRVVLQAINGVPGEAAYIIRRDEQSTVLVRPMSTGVVTYDATGTINDVHDYEARQGLTTTYILTDSSGLQIATTTITIPKWGTWIKSPGRPHMNVKVLWNGDNDYTRKARRNVIQVRGAKFPVAHTDRRMSPSGNVRLATETNAQAKTLTTLLDQGGVLMIDVDPDFGVPVRYVSVGDVSGSRVGPNDRGLKWEARYWNLQVDEVAPPIGLPAGQSLTYEAIPAEFDSYIALAAIVPTYDDLAAGTW